MALCIPSDEESRFKFTGLQERYDFAEQLIVGLPLASSLNKPYWPQSYERSMDLYAGSPSSVGRSFLQRAKEFHRQSSDLSPSICPRRVSDAELPLLNNAAQNVEDKSSHVDDSELAFQHHMQSTSHTIIQEGQSSFFQAVLNGVNMLAGLGILSMSYAVSQGGWAGLSFLFLFALICLYTGFLLRRCLELHPNITGFPDVGQAAFGKLGRLFASSMLYGELFACAIEFLILEGDNLTQIISFEGLNLGFFQLSSEKSFVILSAAVMLPTVWLRDLSLLSYLSAGGVLACVTVLLAVAWTAIFEVSFTNDGRLLNLQGLPIAVGLYAFCYGGHSLFPNLYSSMKDKSKFSHVLVVCFAICTLIYGGIAVLGFLMFGNDSESQVTLNLPQGTVATEIAIIATLVNPFAKYALCITPLASALEELLPLGLKGRSFLLWGLTIRMLLVVTTVVIALTVPFFAYLMAFIGSFLSTSVTIIIPCLCYMKLFAGRIPLWERILVYLVLAVGLGTCVAGTYSAILEIAKGLLTTTT